MTLTETRPEPVATPPRAVAAPRDMWVTTADHKKLGLLLIGGAVVFLVVGGIVGGIVRTASANTGLDIEAGNYARLFSMHAMVTPLLFLAPAWLGLATYLVP